MKPLVERHRAQPCLQVTLREQRGNKEVSSNRGEHRHLFQMTGAEVPAQHTWTIIEVTMVSKALRRESRFKAGQAMALPDQILRTLGLF